MGHWDINGEKYSISHHNCGKVLAQILDDLQYQYSETDEDPTQYNRWCEICELLTGTKTYLIHEGFFRYTTGWNIGEIVDFSRINDWISDIDELITDLWFYLKDLHLAAANEIRSKYLSLQKGELSVL